MTNRNSPKARSRTRRPRCRAKTVDGSPCRNPAKQGSAFCGSHAGNAGAPPKAPSDPVVGGVGKSNSDAICALAAVGATRNRIARELHISPSTLNSWLERGELDAEVGDSSEFHELFERFEAARAKFVSTQLKRLDKAAAGDWRAAVKLLEVVLRDEFGPKTAVEHSGSVNIVEQHADQLLEPLLGLLADLGMADDPRVPDLIEQHFTPLERRE